MADAEIQGGRGIDEPLERVGSGNSFNIFQEQSPLEQAEPDPTRYSELLQIFDKTLQRWRENICIPEYFLGKDQQEGRSDESSLWEYNITYPPTTPPRIIPEEYNGAEKKHIAPLVLEVFLNEYGYNTHEFSIRASNLYDNEAFKDSYTNEELRSLTVVLAQRHFSIGLTGKPSYSLVIGERTKPDHKPRGLEYLVGYPNGQLHLKVRKVEYVSMSVSKNAEVLSEPHALALFNLMDTLIPDSTSPTLQPGCRASQETPTQKVIPPTLRRKPGR